MDIRYDDTFSVVCQILYSKVVGVTSSKGFPVQRENPASSAALQFSQCFSETTYSSQERQQKAWCAQIALAVLPALRAISHLLQTGEERV